MDELAFDQLNPDCVRRVLPTDVDRALEVKERGDDGSAKLMISVPDGWTAIWLRLDHKTRLDLLKSSKNVDGTVLFQAPDGEWVGLVIECKKTLTSSAFSTASQQLAAGVTRLELFARFLGLPIRQHKAWIATREDRVLDLNSTNPALARRQDHVRDYQSRALNNCTFTNRLPFEIVLLDGAGNGQTTLAAG
ncbi:hypothetical protein L6R49_26845 [Myxococcota bacterium]|nr:hypothetical protein [Myxococcota bacterium]